MFKGSAFILIGGKSERFNSPKWKAVIGGDSVLNRLWNVCSNFENRFVVGKEKPENLNKLFIHDEFGLQAPINGLYTALKHTETDWNLLLSCDLPLMDANVFKVLWDAKTNKSNLVTPIINDRFQGTCALYHKCILPLVESAIDRSEYSLFSLANKVSPIKINFINDNRFWNMNTKKDYKQIIKYVSKQN